MVDLKAHAFAWAALNDTVEKVTVMMEVQADPIEKAAHRHMTDPQQYKRRGQYPTLIGTSGEGATFNVTNGHDHDDDFRITLTWEVLG